MAITDVSTANVVTVRSGSGWNVDVTACNLLDDLGVKDFVVLENGTLANTNDYDKTSATLLTYVGAGVGTNTSIEVRRKTPVDLFDIVSFGDIFSSDTFNKNIALGARHDAENDLNPAGTVSLAIPVDDPFDSSWDNDTVRPPTRNVVYDWGITLAPLASPAFTGNPTAPTPSTADNDTSVATTAFVQNNLADYATIASPNLSGTPTAPNPTDLSDSTQIATTAWVRDIFTPLVLARKGDISNFLDNTNTDVVYNSELIDSNSIYDTSTGVFTIPANQGGHYLVTASITLSGTAISNFTRLALGLYTSAGTFVQRLFDIEDGGTLTELTHPHGTVLVQLSSSTGYKIQCFQTNLGATTATTPGSGGFQQSTLSVMRLPVLVP